MSSPKYSPKHGVFQIAARRHGSSSQSHEIAEESASNSSALVPLAMPVPTSLRPQTFPFPNSSFLIEKPQSDFLSISVLRHGYRLKMTLDKIGQARFWTERNVNKSGDTEDRVMLREEARYTLALVEHEAADELYQLSPMALTMLYAALPVNHFTYEKASAQKTRPELKDPDILAFNRDGCRYFVAIAKPADCSISYQHESGLVKTRSMTPDEIAYARRMIVTEICLADSVVYGPVLGEMQRRYEALTALAVATTGPALKII